MTLWESGIVDKNTMYDRSYIYVADSFINRRHTPCARNSGIIEQKLRFKCRNLHLK